MEQNSNQETKLKRPDVTIDDVKNILRDYYKIQCDTVTELNAYDDRNFWIRLSTDGCSDYVLKITNEIDSQNTDILCAQTDLLSHVAESGINCSKPIRTLNGNLVHIVDINGQRNAVRLLTFVSGQVLDKAPQMPSLYTAVGKLIAELNNALQGFSATPYLNHRFTWMFEEAPKIEQHLHVITDSNRRIMVQTVLRKFKENVLERRDEFEIGLIHGDCNEQNIIVTKSSTGNYQINGVIDFGDVNYSFRIFDLAIAMTYMMIHSGTVDTGKYVLSGYKSVKSISEQEANVLSTCIQTRLCQSLVLGLYSYTMYPGNEYVLSSQKHGWTILEELYKMSDSEALNRWSQ